MSQSVCYTAEEAVSAGRLIGIGSGKELRQIEFRSGPTTQVSSDVAETQFGRRNGRNDIPSVNEAIRRRPERSVIPGDEIRPADAWRTKDEDLSCIETLLTSGSVDSSQRDGSPENMSCEYLRVGILFENVF
jgi:hypothetical protein